MAARKARSGGENERRRVAAKEMLERRARWMVAEWRTRPTDTPTDIMRDCRERFGCGILAAKKSMTRCLEIRRENFQALDLSFFVDRYNDLYERALSKGNENAARKILDSMAINTGIAKPRQVVAAIAVGQVSPEQLAHVGVLSMTPAQRDNRLRELEEKARSGTAVVPEDIAPPDDVIDVVSSAAGAPDDAP
jgi:hypothetical protein